jgi:hypothetical protein
MAVGWQIFLLQIREILYSITGGSYVHSLDSRTPNLSKHFTCSRGKSNSGKFPLKYLWLFALSYHWREKFPLKHLWVFIVSNHWHEIHVVRVDSRLYTEQGYFRSRSIQARVPQGSTRLLLSPLLTHHRRPKMMQWLPIPLLPRLQITSLQTAIALINCSSVCTRRYTGA